MPTRSCVVCKKRNEKKNLIRIVSIEGKAIIDKNQKINSRAIYFCNNENCINKFIKLSQKKKINIKSNIDMESIEKALNDIK
mgnify:FL=1